VREYRTQGSLAGLMGDCQSYATHAIAPHTRKENQESPPLKKSKRKEHHKKWTLNQDPKGIRFLKLKRIRFGAFTQNPKSKRNIYVIKTQNFTNLHSRILIFFYV
jgi:hypothetical protein